jgi:Zn ribbon nucleic-acid-binding protein|tara:strand:- start:1421 stop:1672 length:252 start_codon:yes stop_codon:yes gene_type:complete
VKDIPQWALDKAIQMDVLGRCTIPGIARALTAERERCECKAADIATLYSDNEIHSEEGCYECGAHEVAEHIVAAIREQDEWPL